MMYAFRISLLSHAHVLAWSVAVLLAILAHHTATAAELLMLEQRGCSWCIRWHKEIGEIYPKTAEGRRAPLRIVDIDEPLPADLPKIFVDRFTPTFVLIDDGREIGRMRGYPGEEFFWYLLGELFKDLPDPPDSGKTSAS